MDRPVYWRELNELWRHGRFAEVIAKCTKIADELSRQPVDAYPESAYLIEDVAKAYYYDGEYWLAALELERAVDAHRQHYKIPSDDAVRCLYLLGRIYLWTGRPAEAEVTLTQALTLLDHLPIAEQSGRGFVLVDLAQLYRFEGEFDASERLLLQAIKPMLDYFGYGNEHFGFVFLHLSAVYEKQGRTVAADRAMEKCIRWLRFSIRGDDSEFAKALAANGRRLKKRGKLGESRNYLAEALEMLRRIRRHDHYLVEAVGEQLSKVDEAILNSAG